MMPCPRFCRSPAGARSAPARSRSPAAPIRYCRRRSASARPVRPPSRWSARRLRSVGIAHRAAPRGSGRYRQATASLRSGHCMQMDGAHVSTERNTGMGGCRSARWQAAHSHERSPASEERILRVQSEGPTNSSPVRNAPPHAGEGRRRNGLAHGPTFPASTPVLPSAVGQPASLSRSGSSEAR